MFIVADDSAPDETEHELELVRDKLRPVLDMMPAGLLIHQRQAIIYANAEAGRLTNANEDELKGRHLLDYMAPESQIQVGAIMEAAFDGQAITSPCEAHLQDNEGHDYTVQVTASPLPWQGVPVIQIILHDITELKAKEAELTRLATVDPLTGAMNRRYFAEMAEAEISRRRRHGGGLFLLAFDLDHFKRVNDTYGHAVGDEVLRRFTQHCIEIKRVEDQLCRLGGEEFVLMTPATQRDGAVILAERIRKDFEGLVIDHAKGSLRVTVSIGVSEVRAEDESVEAALIRADHALYRAKALGRNRVELSEEVSFFLQKRG